MKVKKIETPHFKHSFQARNSKELEAVFAEYDLAGIALYWIIVETLYCENGVLPLSYTKVLAKKWHADESIINGLLNLQIDNNKSLFEKNDTEFWCNGVNNRLEEIKERIETARQNALKRWNKDSADAEQEESKGTPKGKRGKGKKTKEYIKIPNAKLTNLTKEEFATLIEKHSEQKTLKAIEIFNNWLEKRGKTAKSYIGKGHYAHFKVDGWVWEEANKAIQKEMAKSGTNSNYGEY